MSRPTKATVAGRAYLAVQRQAKVARRTTAEYLRLYALEGFLLRLSRSAHCDRFVLKGGVLLAAYALRRPTTDIDVAALRMTNDVEAVRRYVTDIVATVLPPDLDDGLVFDMAGVTADVIRDEDTYSGVRVRLLAQLTSRWTWASGPAASGVAVGTALAGGPPHRSQRAELPHWAPASGSGCEAHVRVGMHRPDFRKPSSCVPVHPFPVDPSALASPPQRPMPVPSHLIPESRYRIRVARYGVVGHVPLQHLSQPSPLHRDGIMPAILELALDFCQLRPHAFLDRDTPHPEPPSPQPRADMRKAQGRCCVVGSVDALSPVSGSKSDRLGEFGERSGDPQGGWGVGSEFVVAASEVLYERVSGDDDLCCLVRS
jgi:hypothetical protein